MFGTKKSGNSAINNQTSSNRSKAINTIVGSTSIEGNINSDNDIRIDGNLIGDLECRAKVIIGPQGKVKGEINCVNAVIEGKFEGNITVKESLLLSTTAEVKANIVYHKTWVVASGAAFTGTAKMGNTATSIPKLNTKKQKHNIAKRTKTIAK